MTYCSNSDCPFKDCDTHPSQLEGQSGEKWFADTYKVCKRYISYVYEEVANPTAIDNTRFAKL